MPERWRVPAAPSERVTPLDADPRPGTRPLAGTALGAFSIQLVSADPACVVARMPTPASGSTASLYVLAETVASTAAGLEVGPGRRAFGAELDAATLEHEPWGAFVEARATPLALARERHVWQIDVRDGADTLVLRGRCTLSIVDAPAD